jgi:hypothetical protein
VVRTKEAAEVEVTVVPTTPTGAGIAMDGKVAMRSVPTAAAWVEVVDEKPVMEAPVLEQEVGQPVEVVLAAVARRALRSGVAISVLVCSGPNVQKTLGLGDRMRARR